MQISRLPEKLPLSFLTKKKTGSLILLKIYCQMKKIVLSLLLFLPMLSIAQVKFSSITFEEAKLLAAKQGKNILVDVCRTKPEKFYEEDRQRIKELFGDKNIAKYINDNFVTISIDMSNPENANFSEMLSSLMYPCVCFYTSKGVQLESTSWAGAAKNPEKFKSAAEKSVADAIIKSKNSRKIEFRNLSFEEAVATAKRENKLVFIDAYTSWCRPCKQMEMHVFSLDKVADFFNENFICVKYDFHKDRPDLAKRFGVRGYPTYLFVSGDTVVARTASGYTEADKLIAEGEKAKENLLGMKFTEGSWSDIVKMAQKENKMIFVDCFTVWCGPCKVIARTVFKDPEVAALMNDKFINVKVDMEKGEGVDLKNKFEVKAFPTLLFISPQGEVEHRIVGSVASKKFIGEANVALAGEGLSAYERKYRSGVKDTSFLKKYIQILANSYKLDEASSVAAEYLGIVGVNGLAEKDSWNIFKEFCNDAYSPSFNYFVENQADFAKKYGEKEVAQKIDRVWRTQANSFTKKEGKGFVFDRKGLDEFVAYMQKKNVKDVDNIKFFALLNAYFTIENWGEAANMINGGIKKGDDYSLMLLYNWALRVDQKCSDAAVRKQAVVWVDLGLKKAATAPSGEMYVTSFNKIKENLLKQKAQ